MEGIAKPGAICLSEDAYRQVKARLDLAVTDLGPTQLKNIAEPLRVYALEVGIPAKAKPTTETKPPEPSAHLALPDRPSIAVLGFQNMSDDPAQEYFADGEGEWTKPALFQVQYHGITEAANLETWRGMSYQTVVYPSDRKTGDAIYPYEKAK